MRHITPRIDFYVLISQASNYTAQRQATMSNIRRNLEYVISLRAALRGIEIMNKHK